jgi:hypothetical protein
VADRVVFRQTGGKGLVELEKSTGKLLAFRETEAPAPEEGPRLTPRHPLRRGVRNLYYNASATAHQVIEVSIWSDLKVDWRAQIDGKWI